MNKPELLLTKTALVIEDELSKLLPFLPHNAKAHLQFCCQKLRELDNAHMVLIAELRSRYEVELPEIEKEPKTEWNN